MKIFLHITSAIIIFIATSQITKGQTKSVHKISCSIKFESTLNRNYYISANEMPTFRRGENAMFKIIARNLKWPDEDCCIQGTVYVTFIIEPNGELTNRRIGHSPFRDNDVCLPNKEALKVLDYLTEWNPGKCGGKNVAILYTLPIKFVLR